MTGEIKDSRKSDQDYDSALSRLDNNSNITSEDKKRIKQFLDDCTIGKYSRDKVNIKRRLRYLNDILVLSDYFHKPWLKITEKEITGWYMNLEQDKIKKRRNINQAYKPAGKNSFVCTLHKFGKWLYKENNEQYQKLFGWTKKFKEDMEVPALKRDEIEQIANASDTRDKAIIMFLFDSGARASEFLNVKLSDLRKEEKYYKVRIRISKTKPRTIILPIASQYLDSWLKIHPSKEDPDSFLFPLTYDGLRIMLRRKGNILNKRVYPHLLRHSSATFYANRYKNPYKMAYRYGWAMNSDEVQRYIDREGIEEEDIKEIMDKESNNSLQKENERIKEELALLRDDHNKLFSIIKKLDSLAAKSSS